MTPGVEVRGAAEDAVRRHVPSLVAERFASRLFARDATLWGPAAEPEASKRLAWVSLASASRPLVDEILSLRQDLAEDGVDRVVLCGMGGSSLAPEVICATHGVRLVVLDSSHPDQVRAAVTDLERTVVVVSSKSGSTVETDSQRRVFEAAFRDAGIDPARRIVVVTDPGSPLDQDARGAGYRVVNAEPEVGGRYSALTAFGLVPSGLAGADVGALLDEAAAVAGALAADAEDNPGLRLGAALAGTEPLRDKLLLVDEGSGIAGFPAWAEQLVAESTGKDGTGLLPVVVGGPDAPELRYPAAADLLVVALTGPGAEPPADGVAVAGRLGAQLLLWEVATAVAGRLLGINPFDQPDVESAKQAARSFLEGGHDLARPELRDGPVSFRGRGGGSDWLGDAQRLPDAVRRLLAQVDEAHGYLAVTAYLDREAHAPFEEVRDVLARRLGRPVTFGWGPRFLHSTGQLHKGGPPVGVFLQITDEPRQDLAVPGRDFGFATLIAAQAAGDADVLADGDHGGRPVLQVHLDDPDAGLSRVRQALEDKES